MLLDGHTVTYSIALLAGIVTFLTSCFLPLVPTYLAYLSGLSLSSSSTTLSKPQRMHLFIHSLVFSLGFLVVFSLLGLAATSFGSLFNQYRPLFQKLGGGLLVAMGLFMLGFLKMDFLYQEKKFNLIRYPVKWHHVNSFLVGSTFGFAWTPCIGPVLAVILFWASQQQTVFMGVTLLIVYGLGMAIPFMVIGLLYDLFAHRLKTFTSLGHWLHIIAAYVIISTGILLILGHLEWLNLMLVKQIGLDALTP